MKKIILICTLGAFLVVNNGCKKPPLPIPQEEGSGTGSGGSGGGGTVEPSPFVGTWDYTNIDLENGTLEFQGNEVGTFEGKGTSIDGEVVLTENPNEWESTLEFTADIDAMFFGQSQNQEVPVDEVELSGTWEESNGEITMTLDNGDEVAIISSTSSKIVFTGNFTEQISVGGQGFTLDANSDVEFTITK